MKKILFVILLLLLAHNGFAGEMTTEELTQKIEQGLAGINSMTFTYTLGYWPKTAGKSNIVPLTSSKQWYKKPGLAKVDSESLYLPNKPQYHYVYRLESDGYHLYETLEDGSIKETSHPAQEWDASGATPAYIYQKMKERLAKNIPSRIRYQAGRDIYFLKFDAPDEATFEISGDSWLPYSLTVVDGDNIVEVAWSDIVINPELSDELFRVPEKNDLPQAQQATAPDVHPHFRHRMDKGRSPN